MRRWCDDEQLINGGSLSFALVLSRLNPSFVSSRSEFLHVKKMAAFLGKFKMYNTQNFDEYMKALGVGMVMRKMAATATPVQDITLDGDTYTIKTTTTFKTTEIKFKLGEPFDEETADGRKVKTTIVQEGDKLVQTQVGDKQTTTLTRDFSVPSEMKMTLVVDNVTCIRNYKKE